MDYPGYLEAVGRRLKDEGFAPHPDQPRELLADQVFHKRYLAITKFSLADCFVLPVYVPEAESLTPAWIEAYSADSFAYSLARKSWLPRGLFGGLEVFPLVVADTVSSEVRQFLGHQYLPKHWAAFEFPSAFELSTGTLHSYQETPLWGAAYFAGFRQRAARYFRT